MSVVEDLFLRVVNTANGAAIGTDTKMTYEVMHGNFSLLPDFSKWILSAGMILGRLELFAIIVLFIPSFWRRY